MRKVPVQPPTDTVSRIVDLFVEQRMRLDALEHALKETNPLLHEFYLGTVENLQKQKAAEVKRMLVQTLRSELAEG